MPKYDVFCTKCNSEKEIFMTFTEYDASKDTGVLTYCVKCKNTTRQEIIMLVPASVEWRTDGAYNYDNADQWTRYQRNHYAESGDRSDKKLAMRKRRRPELGYIE